jgi:hypothetical protein
VVVEMEILMLNQVLDILVVLTEALKIGYPQTQLLTQVVVEVVVDIEATLLLLMRYRVLTVVRELSSFVTPHHNQRQFPQQEALI